MFGTVSRNALREFDSLGSKGGANKLRFVSNRVVFGRLIKRWKRGEGSEEDIRRNLRGGGGRDRGGGRGRGRGRGRGGGRGRGRGGF